MLPLIGSLGTPELLLIFLVVILLFGATKLPDLARGSGRALRIFKAETKGLMDDDDDAPAESTTTAQQLTPEETARQRELESRQAELDRRQAEIDAERDRLNHPDSGV
ncbi:Sec-independent protein translocase subunit TatA [Nocardioides sp.]|uniref:Sec-independent protein translocase subunit TatA n=1 Tax=Nocardioides sp. TaxID=35761 RepID=UPI00378371B5